MTLHAQWTKPFMTYYDEKGNKVYSEYIPYETPITIKFRPRIFDKKKYDEEMKNDSLRI